MGKKLTTEEFITRSKGFYGDRYDYSETVYEHSLTKVKIICKLHGPFLALPTSHVRGVGGCCSVCIGLESSKRQAKGITDFKKCASLLHENKYTYDKAEYVNTMTHLIITCPYHSDFTQIPNSHLQGAGCPKCSWESRNTYNDTLAYRNKEDFLHKRSGLYVIKVEGVGQDNVYKVGLTGNINKRLKALGRELGEPPKVLYYFPNNLYDTVLKEQSLHRMLSSQLFNTPIKFAGYTECFALNEEEVSELIHYLDNTFGKDTEIHE